MPNRLNSSLTTLKHQSPVRVRLLILALLPMLVILPVLLALGVFYWHSRYDGMLISKVNSDLTIAHQYFVARMDNTGEQVEALGRSAAFATASQQPETLATLLSSAGRSHLDFLYVVDQDGQLIAASPANAQPLLPQQWPVVRAALDGTATTAIDVLSHDNLQAISAELAQRTQLGLVDTANASPTNRNEENRGMIVHTASPVQLADGRRGALVGGLVLNGNLAVIDTINDLVYQQASLPEGSRGTATLFLDDVRISTNVRLFENRRALGTRVSAAVRQTVLEEGQVWLDRAFVVNDWYISAYEPISDSFGRRVGMLYVGFLEAPFRHAKFLSLGMVILAFLIAAVITIPVLLHWARGIFLPLENMNATISRVENGEFSARTRLDNASDEISRVANHLDDLLDQLQTRNQELQQAAVSLNDRVESRTRELRQANEQLEATTRQLIVSEKLAAIGEIAAGMAHEINNPVAVMQGNLDLMRDLLGEQTQPVETEIRLIDQQLHRINLIVTRLLQFARPDEYAGDTERVAPAAIFSDCLPLVQHLIRKGSITVTEDYRATRLVSMSRSELQQVLVNIIVNAIHAMPDGGELTLRDDDCDLNGAAALRLDIIDTGNGMDEQTQARIFDPFFTTKAQHGTGLGLSISQTLIVRHGGEIHVYSAAGRGTRFEILLPATAQLAF